MPSISNLLYVVSSANVTRNSQIARAFRPDFACGFAQALRRACSCLVPSLAGASCRKVLKGGWRGDLFGSGCLFPKPQRSAASPPVRLSLLQSPTPACAAREFYESVGSVPLEPCRPSNPARLRVLWLNSLLARTPHFSHGAVLGW